MIQIYSFGTERKYLIVESKRSEIRSEAKEKYLSRPTFKTAHIHTGLYTLPELVVAIHETQSIAFESIGKSCISSTGAFRLKLSRLCGRTGSRMLPARIMGRPAQGMQSRILRINSETIGEVFEGELRSVVAIETSDKSLSASMNNMHWLSLVQFSESPTTRAILAKGAAQLAVDTACMELHGVSLAARA